MPLKKSDKLSLIQTFSEAELLSTCLRLLKNANILHWRNPVQASLYTRNGKTFMRPSPIKGFPDISFLGPDGRLFCAELKSKKGRLSEDQEIWLMNLNASGARACVIRNPQEMIDFIAESRNCLYPRN